MKQFTADDQVTYLNFLRNLLKDQSYVALAYMTGILPIKKYGEHSALNMFTEISMTFPEPYSEFTGFTESEVSALCRQYQKDFDVIKQWYDGYCVDEISIYNPRSVVESMIRGKVMNYWNATETYKALQYFIRMNFDGLREKVTGMIAGEDDILTLLIHLGYLTYDFRTGKAWIPNSEVRQEFINSIEDGGWEEIIHAIRSSDALIQATLDGDTGTVAAAFSRGKHVHSEI